MKYQTSPENTFAKESPCMVNLRTSLREAIAFPVHISRTDTTVYHYGPPGSGRGSSFPDDLIELLSQMQ